MKGVRESVNPRGRKWGYDKVWREAILQIEKQFSWSVHVQVDYEASQPPVISSHHVRSTIKDDLLEAP